MVVCPELEADESAALRFKWGTDDPEALREFKQTIHFLREKSPAKALPHIGRDAPVRAVHSRDSARFSRVPVCKENTSSIAVPLFPGYPPPYSFTVNCKVDFSLRSHVGPAKSAGQDANYHTAVALIRCP